jgi:hypothetical protein
MAKIDDVAHLAGVSNEVTEAWRRFGTKPLLKNQMGKTHGSTI